MLHRLWSLIVKELLSYLRDPRTRFILIGPPLVQLFVFSFAATLDVRNVAVGVLNEDAGEPGRELVTRITGAGFVGTVRVTHSLAELEHLVERREVLLGVHLAADFSRNVGAGSPAPVQLLSDGRRANAGQSAAGYVGFRDGSCRASRKSATGSTRISSTSGSSCRTCRACWR